MIIHSTDISFDMRELPKSNELKVPAILVHSSGTTAVVNFERMPQEGDIVALRVNRTFGLIITLRVISVDESHPRTVKTVPLTLDVNFADKL